MKFPRTPVLFSTLSLSREKPTQAKGRPGYGAALIVCCGLGAIVPAAFGQTTYYWDGNGATTGSGATTLAGTWGSSAYWGTSVDGTSATTAAILTSADTAVFAAHDATPGNNFNAGYAVTLNGPQSIAGLVIEGGSATTGGTPQFTGTGAPGLTIGAGGIILNGSAGDPTTNANLGTMTLGADQTWTVNNAHALKFSSPIAGNATMGNTRLWTLGYINAFSNDYNGVISDGSGGGKLAITVDNYSAGPNPGAGTNYLANAASLYTGKTTIKRGLLQVKSIGNAGANSGLGAPTGNDAVIDMGMTTFGATLQFANGTTPSVSDRIIKLAGTTGGATIKNNNSTANTVTISGGVSNAGGGNKTLALAGSNTGDNTLGLVADAVDLSKTAISKSEAGKWILSADNTFTGGVTLTAGSLTFSNATNHFDGVIAVSGASSLLTFSGSNTFTKGLSANSGTVIVGAAGGLGADVVGNNIVMNGGNLQFNTNSNFTNINRSIIINSGGIGLGAGGILPPYTDNSGGFVLGLNFTGDAGITGLTGNTFLGSFTGGTFTGASLTPGNGATYRLGGGGGHLIIQNNVLAGANSLLVGSTGGGAVTLPNANTFTGTTTIQNGILNVSRLNKVVGGTASSSLGAPTSVANGTITLGSGANAVMLNYTGFGETTDRVLKFAGGAGSVTTLGNSGSGAVIYSSATTFTGAGARTVVLGNNTDSVGGSIGGIADAGVGNATTLRKGGLKNSTWVLTSASHTGNTQIDGGVLDTALSNLATSYLNLDGDDTTHLAVIQSSGTLARTISGTAAATNIRVGTNSGFSAKGGKLTVTLSGGAPLVWGDANFLGDGTNHLVFGSTTSDSQVEFTNAINLNTGDAFQRRIYVEQGTGGDSTLLSGVLSPGLGLTGVYKLGGGTLILSATNTYTGATFVEAGKLLITGSIADGAVNVLAGGTLGGGGNGTTTGVIGGSISVATGGHLAPGTSVGTLTAAGNVTIAAGASLDVEVNATVGDKIAAGGILAIGGSTLNITSLAPPISGVYIIATYGSRTGEFTNVFGLPDGYQVQYDYNGNQIALVNAGSVTPFQTWAMDHSLTGDNALPEGDPDKDGVKNILEFALNSDPNSGASRGLMYVQRGTVGGMPNVLTLTIAVRESALFAADGNRQKATADQITYTVEATNTLQDWGGPVVTQVTGTDATTLQAPLQTPDTGWYYVTFRTDDSAASDPSDFIRVGVQ